MTNKHPEQKELQRKRAVEINNKILKRVRKLAFELATTYSASKWKRANQLLKTSERIIKLYI